MQLNFPYLRTEKFNMQEPSLQTALYVITHDQIVSARTAAERDIQTRTPGPARRGANDHRPAPTNAERPARLLPDEVFRAIPRHDDKPVCLRFLSSRGCPSTYPDRLCRKEGRLHARNPGASIKILKGDVKSAYRHVPVHASVADRFTRNPS